MLRPTGSLILVVDHPHDDKRDSGLIVPDHYNAVRVGVVKDFQEMNLEIVELGISKGDVVYYTEGCEVQIKDMTLVNAHHVVALDKMEE
jgi:co-chaperonin GroES (HSP10)